jgi:hypothetical protein
MDPTDQLPLEVYFSHYAEEGPDLWEPEPTISWHFLDTQGCEDYADQRDVAMTCRCYIDAGCTFTATLEYTEPEEV